MLLFKGHRTFGEFGDLDSEGNRCDCECMYGIMRNMMSNRPVATSASETLHLKISSDQ